MDFQQKLLDYMRRIIDLFESDEKGNTIYPDWYAGAFMDHQKGQIVIYTTDFAELKCLQQLSINEDLIRYEYRPHSRNELNGIADYITSMYEELYQMGINIHGVGVDEVESTVHIYIDKADDTILSLLSLFLDCDFLAVEQDMGFHKQLNVGASHSINYGASTLGFAASRNGIIGFVIAGHAGPENSYPMCYGIQIGCVVECKYVNNTTADASFVQSNGNCGRTSVLVTGDKIISVSNTALPTGVTVVKYGVTTGLTVGSIIYTSYNQQDSPTMWVNNQMVASFSNAPGDSGGPVMVYNGMSGSQVLYKLVGIIAGGNGTYGYFSPYQNIWNELGVIPYIE